MCGLAGVAYRDGRPVDPAIVTRMTRALAHRGPDDEGFHFGPGIGLGHRRLSIVDLSADGRQPMSNEDGSVWVAFNGEIYNHADLRQWLVGRGHRFKSQADTEVLVHLYEEKGADLVQDLRGMFAFGIWDADARRLLLARDRIGIKPLFFTEHDEGIAFGSEIKAILCDPGVPRTIDTESLDAYLAQGWIGAPRTLLRHIRQLEPGQLLEFGSTTARRDYWDLHFAEAPGRSEGEWIDRVETALREAVRSHLMADVPYGALLSGGVDSSTLVGILVKEHQAPTLTFTADFRESAFGEGDRAHMVATSVGAENERIPFGVPSVAQLQTIVAHAEEPTADASMLPFHAVCGLARRRVKVALSGEGADEVFAGYQTYPASLAARALRRIPAPFLSAMRAAIELLPDSEGKVTRTEKAKRFLRGVAAPGESAHFAWRQICSPELRRALGAAGALVPEAAAFDRANGGPLDRLQYVDLRRYLPSDMLVKADRMSMAHGLEIRVPYLDHPLVELAATLPPGLRLHRLTRGKWILRRIADRVLPPAARPLPGKLGFNVPLATWFRGPLREAAGDLLSGARLARQGILRPDAAASVFADHERGRDRGYELYNLLMLTLWADHLAMTPHADEHRGPASRGTT
jgi:asparagine synthase (glutamine-hydrolysing)